MKKLISILLSAFMILSLVSCSGESENTSENTDAMYNPGPENTEPEQTQPAEKTIPLCEGEQAKLYIFTGAQDDNNILYAKDKLFYFVKNSAGAELGFGKDEGSEYELLLGDTGRPESEELKSTLSGNEYGIKVAGNKIIIAATHPAFLYDAVEYMINDLVRAEEGKIELNTASTNIVGIGNTSSLRYLFSQSKDLISTIARSDGWPDEIIGVPEGTQHVQGGCSDGEYIYQGFIFKDSASNEKNNVCKIVKIKPDFDPNTSDIVLTSGALDLNHTNDITYNSKTNELIVVHNNPYRTKLTVIDPETLEFKRNIKIPDNIYSLSYNPERDAYVLGLSGGQTMKVMDGEFDEIITRTIRPTNDTRNMTTQGICSDDTFIYHTLWNTKGEPASYNKNVITVYDWYGNYVGMIGTKIAIESENIFIYDGELYVCAYSSGGKASYAYKIEAKVK